MPYRTDKNGLEPCEVLLYDDHDECPICENLKSSEDEVCDDCFEADHYEEATY